jgi:hypothetical protein
MIRNQHLINALPLVADVLGRKYGVQVRIGGNEAYTDGNVIQLPGLPVDSDETVRSLVRGYIDHESAHIRYSDFSVLLGEKLTRQEHFLANIFEDYRVEQAMAAMFPGCGHNLDWLTRHLLGEGYEQGENLSPEKLVFTWLVFAVTAWDIQEFLVRKEEIGIQVTARYPGLLQELEIFVQTVPERCLSTQASIELGRECLEILKKYVRDNRQVKNGSTDHPGQEDMGQSGHDEVSGQHGLGQQSEQAEKYEDISSTQEMGQDASTQPETSSISGESQEEQDIRDTGTCQEVAEVLRNLESFLEEDDPDLPKSGTELLFEAIRQLPQQTGEILTVAIPSGKTTSSLSAEEQNSARQATTALRTRLQAVLQSTDLTRNRRGFTGKLDTHRLSRTSVGDARIFLRQNRRQAINTAIHILLDASGSMCSCMKLASQACFAVASALESIPGTGTAITVFPADPIQAHDSSHLIGQTVFPLLKHKEKLHTRMNMSAGGNTPLGSALWWVIQRMHVLSEERKIILIITDGRPDNESEAIKAIETARLADMEVYGIGIADAAIMRLLPENGMIVRDISELAFGMFAMLRKAMVIGRGLP